MRLIEFFILLLAVAAIAAAQLPDYQARVQRAIEHLEAELGGGDLGHIKSLLPASEYVELDGQKIAVDNSWLHSLLDSYSQERDPNKRKQLLEEARSRLRALSEHLGQLQGRRSGDAQSSRQKLRQILSRPEFQPKKEDPFTALIKEIRRRILELLQRLLSRIFRALYGSGSEPGLLFKISLIVALVAATFVAVRLFFRLRPSRRPKMKRTILGQEIPSWATPQSLAQEALAAAGSGDFRSAIRKLYIALLYELSELRLIELAPDATNWEYLSKVSAFEKLSSPMCYLTERFDHFWYGMFPSSEEDFSAYLERYNEAVQAARAQPVAQN
jgi:hypothetical protein